MSTAPAIHRERLAAPTLPRKRQKRPDIFFCSWGKYDLAQHPTIQAFYATWTAKVNAPAPLMLPSGNQAVALLAATVDPISPVSASEAPISSLKTPDHPRLLTKRQHIVMGGVSKKHGISRFNVYCPATLMSDVVTKCAIYGRVEKIDRERQYVTVALIEDMVINRNMLRAALDKVAGNGN